MWVRIPPRLPLKIYPQSKPITSVTILMYKILKIKRRRFIPALIGFFFAEPLSGRFWLPREKHYPDLPPSWVAAQGSCLPAYETYLNKLKLKHIKTKDIIAAHAKYRKGVWNSIPPKKYWRNILVTLRVADKIADRLNANVTSITSVYRSPAYNDKCSGAHPDSLHKTNYALDIKYNTHTYKVVKEAEKIRKEGYYKGGIGRYATFTHIDCRGQNNDW